MRILIGLSAIVLSVLMAAQPAVAASTTCKKPKSGMSRFLSGVTSKITQRVGGTGVVGDVIGEGRKLLSDTIACALSEAENKQALAAQEKALNSRSTGKSSRTVWTSGNRKGVAGGTEVTTRTRVNGQECALQRTFITDENGEEKSVEKELCQNGDGSWV